MDNGLMQSLMKRETERQFEIQKKKNEMKLIHPEHEQYNYFTDAFGEKLRQINAWLEGASATQTRNELVLHFEKIWKELHHLQKFVADSLMFLRDYDIRVCQKSLQEAEGRTRKLEEMLLPKKKFGFKSKRGTPAPTSAIKAKLDVDETDNKRFISKINRMNEHVNGFKDQRDAELILDGEHLLGKDVTLENLEGCVVRLNGAPSTLHATNLRRCVVLCGPVATSVFAEYCDDCKFAFACQQLRLHSSTRCDVYLHVTSKAIIEDSRQINVAKYNYVYENLPRDYETSSVDETANNWAKIEDFNWLVADKQSPNWRILNDAEQINDWCEYLRTFNSKSD